MTPSSTVGKKGLSGNAYLANLYGLTSLTSIAVSTFLMCSYYWAHHRFGYTPTENLLLSSLQGLVYIFASRWGGRLCDRAGWFTALEMCFPILGVILLLGWIPHWHWTPFVIFFFYCLLLGPTWPGLEVSVLHTPGKLSVPDRTGIYNITWSSGNATGLFLSGLLFLWKPDSILWLMGILHVITWIWITRLGPPPPPDKDSPQPRTHRGNHVPKNVKIRFLHLAWLGNALSYMQMASFYALIPQMAERLHLRPEQALWLTSTLMLSEMTAFILYWKWEGWHYRMSWTQIALWMAPVSLCAAFFSTQVSMVFLGLTCFGFCSALSYSGSLYYSLDHGENQGELGGHHESYIALGIFVGPFLAAGATTLFGGIQGAKWTVVALVLLANTVGSLMFMRRYKDQT